MLPALRRCPALSAQVTGKLVVDAGAPGAAIPDIVRIEEPKSTCRTSIWAVLPCPEHARVAPSSKAQTASSIAQIPVFDFPAPVSNYRFLNIAYRV